MHAKHSADRDKDAERDLVDELARSVLQQIAPEELVLFAETEADYFRDPELVLSGRRRDEAVGFGLEMALMTPYVLAAGTVVVRFLASAVSDAGRWWPAGIHGAGSGDGAGHDGGAGARGPPCRAAAGQAIRAGRGEGFAAGRRIRRCSPGERLTP